MNYIEFMQNGGLTDVFDTIPFEYKILPFQNDSILRLSPRKIINKTNDRAKRNINDFKEAGFNLIKILARPFEPIVYSTKFSDFASKPLDFTHKAPAVRVRINNIGVK